MSEISSKKMAVARSVVFILFALVASFADASITARTAEVSPDGPFVLVDLNSVANDSMTVAVPSDKVQAGNIPFNLVKKEGVNNLFLKPIGWDAAKDESNEYPSYIAKYDMRESNKDNPHRAIVRVPVADYLAVWLLATADDDTNLTNAVTFRLGIMDGQARTVYHDVKFTIPRMNDKNPAGVVMTIPMTAGNLYLIRVPVCLSIAQDFRERRMLDLDITKELRVAVNLPDPYRYQLRPLGLPSGVRIFGMTLQRTPTRMEVTGMEPGNVFNEPQTPAFRIDFWNVGDEHYISHIIETVAKNEKGETFVNVAPKPYVDGAWVYTSPEDRRVITVPVKGRGHYELTINLYDPWKNLVASRKTTFAILPPDTRKYRNESPFGTWDFFGSHATSKNIDLLGPLYVKAGLRYASWANNAPDEKRKEYGLLSGSDPRVTSADDLKWIKDMMTKDASIPPPERFLTFHESAISGIHLTRTPDIFTGRPPYRMSTDEEKTFKSLREEAERSFRAVRANFPKAEIYFGNTVPHLVEEFLRHKFPRELIDKAGNESGNFMRLPETQPLDFVANNSGLWMYRQILDGYGYSDVELKQCLEMCYPNSNPGNLTERTQAVYIVRHMMHSLAWKIPVIRPMCIMDMGNSYYYSNWGASGLCYGWPNVSPKPAYVSFAVMTQVLDGAKFVRNIPIKSTAVYAVEFEKKDKSFVTCLWTIRGTRKLTIESADAKLQILSDMMGRESEISFKDGGAEIAISREPCYLFTAKPVESITLGEVKYEDNPGADAFRVASAEKLSDWEIETTRSVELETYNFMNPRRKGNFEYREVAEFEGMSGVIEVKPKLPCEESKYLQMYSVMAHKTGVEIPGQPTEIGVWVKGNGGWGRVIFELEDASGQRWISIGAEQAGTPNPWMADWLSPEEFAKLNKNSMNVSDWNSDDAWGRSFINHDGWRFVRLQLPGQYPGENYHWPRNSQWRFSGDGIVKYPLKFKKLIITMPENVLYLTHYVAPARNEIYLKDIMVTYDPVDKVFAGE